MNATKVRQEPVSGKPYGTKIYEMGFLKRAEFELRSYPKTKSFEIKELRYVLNMARCGGPLEFQEQHNASIVDYAM